ncbi:MAG TPA: GGDEF domain-containing protein [bacterium]|jgi:diguanylate cyclase (GGDEF)-like protein
MSARVADSILTTAPSHEKQRGVLLASAGYVLALAVILWLSVYGSHPLSAQHWAVLLGATALCQAALWAVPRFGLDRRIAWDPHYVYVPMLVNAVLLSLYMYSAPGARLLLLMGWFASLVFVAGLIGFIGVLILSLVMTAGYLVVVALYINSGVPVSVPFEMLVAAAFLAVNLYIGVVFERLLRQREENRALRRELHEQAITDPLTGLFNRRQFEHVLRMEITRIQRYGGQCTLAIIDLDFFKRYNDNFGHVAGDLILQELAEVMRRQIRSSDLLARYGGEEFALVMPGSTKDAAVVAMERLRHIVEEHPFKDEDVMPRGKMTISIGVASCPEDGQEYDTLVMRADEALYAAKQDGRNLVRLAAV